MKAPHGFDELFDAQWDGMVRSLTLVFGSREIAEDATSDRSDLCTRAGRPRRRITPTPWWTRCGSSFQLPAGGWVGRISGFIPAGGGQLVWVVRSDDGERWSTVLGQGSMGCTDSPADTDFFGAEEPLAVGEDVLVAFACPGRDSGLYRISVEQSRARVVDRLPSDRRFGAPVSRRSNVVVPVHDALGEAVRGFAVVDDE